MRWVEPGSQLQPRLHLSMPSMVVKQNKFRVSVHVSTGLKDTILKVLGGSTAVAEMRDVWMGDAQRWQEGLKMVEESRCPSSQYTGWGSVFFLQYITYWNNKPIAGKVIIFFVCWLYFYHLYLNKWRMYDWNFNINNCKELPYPSCNINTRRNCCMLAEWMLQSICTACVWTVSKFSTIAFTFMVSNLLLKSTILSWKQRLRAASL